MSAPVHAAADVLSMGSDWEAQNKSEATNKDRAEATKADGDFLASDPYGSLKTGTVSYIYIGAGASKRAIGHDCGRIEVRRSSNTVCVRSAASIPTSGPCRRSRNG